MTKQIFWDNQSTWVGIILGFVFILMLVDYFGTTEMILGPSYTIQDVYVHCGRNPEVLITHRGDNCSEVMNIIYNENENWTRTIDNG